MQAQERRRWGESGQNDTSRMGGGGGAGLLHEGEARTTLCYTLRALCYHCDHSATHCGHSAANCEHSAANCGRATSQQRCWTRAASPASATHKSASRRTLASAHAIVMRRRLARPEPPGESGRAGRERPPAARRTRASAHAIFLRRRLARPGSPRESGRAIRREVDAFCVHLDGPCEHIIRPLAAL